MCIQKNNTNKFMTRETRSFTHLYYFIFCIVIFLALVMLCKLSNLVILFVFMFYKMTRYDFCYNSCCTLCWSNEVWAINSAHFYHLVVSCFLCELQVRLSNHWATTDPQSDRCLMLLFWDSEQKVTWDETRLEKVLVTRLNRYFRMRSEKRLEKWLIFNVTFVATWVHAD